MGQARLNALVLLDVHKSLLLDLDRVCGHTSSWEVWRYLRADLIAEPSNKAKI